MGQFISVEMLSEKSKETYYEALKDSSTEWHNSDNDYLPFVKYYLGVVLKGYNEFKTGLRQCLTARLEKSPKPTSSVEKVFVEA